MGQISKLRVAAGFPAFRNTSIDMFGPLQVRLGRKTLKEAHVIIFTCMTTRAVHLEPVTDRSTDTFLMAFRRFVSLRGSPTNCWSDLRNKFHWSSTLPEGTFERLGYSQNPERYLRRIFVYFSVELECPSRQSPERNCGKSQQISTTGFGCYVQKPSPHRRAVENVFSRSYMLNKSASSLPKLKRNLGKPAYHAKRSFGQKSFSTSDARSRIESKSKTPHEKYRETSARVLELLDEIVCSQSAAKKQVVKKA